MIIAISVISITPIPFEQNKPTPNEENINKT